MPSGLRKTTGNHFEIYYEQPWGGIADYANPVDIQPNELVTSQGVLAVDGELSALNVQAVGGTFSFTPHTTNAFMILMWTMAGNLYALDNVGDVYLHHVSAGFLYLVSASDGPWAGITGYSPVGAVKVINGTAYVTIMPRNSVYSFTTAPAFTLGSNYSGGLVLGVLDDYLLQLNVNSSIDGIQPNRISWSGPGEFTTWNPSLNQAAGFNNLANIDDELTGFISLASVGIAISARSLIELSPTGVGIGPFSFTTLWTSVVGQGSIYPESVTQYGQQGFCVTDSGVYTISTGAGFTDISAKAKKSIISSFQFPSYLNFTTNTLSVCGNVLLTFFNSSYPTPYYVFTAPSQAKPGFYVLWLYDLAAGNWYSTYIDAAMIANQQGASIPEGVLTNNNLGPAYVYTLQPITPLGASFGGPYTPVTLVQFNVLYNGVNYSSIAEVLLYNSKTVGGFSSAINLNLTFRAEEIKLGRKPTIRRVVIKAYGFGTLNLSVSGVSFGSVVLNGQSTPTTYESPYGMYTGEAPQLNITSTNFQGSIIKVMLGGTYADGDID